MHGVELSFASGFINSSSLGGTGSSSRSSSVIIRVCWCAECSRLTVSLCGGVACSETTFWHHGHVLRSACQRGCNCHSGLHIKADVSGRVFLSEVASVSGCCTWYPCVNGLGLRAERGSVTQDRVTKGLSRQLTIVCTRTARQCECRPLGQWSDPFYHQQGVLSTVATT